ncbi:MAG: four-carbon acid sugar kinase family protein [Pirellulaceae bacterium]|nr:four-carbon acid sugar kinase family protein [Pirellulaceae bacterium]
MNPIVVLADDLSGAAELAGIAVARGYSAEVQRGFLPGSMAEVIAIDTDSRSLAVDSAAARVAEVTREVLAIAPAWIYKKVDSVLRGNVRAEIEAILHATGQPRAMLIPANPSRGRTIVGGRYLVGGVPLSATSFAADPEFPRRSALIADMLEGSTSAPSQIDVPDVRASSDVSHFAANLPPDTLAAGAADFFAALLAERSHEQASPSPIRAPAIHLPAVLVCGSRQAWNERKRQCLAMEIPYFEVGDRPRSEAIAIDRGVLALGIAEDAAGTPADLLAKLASEVLKVVKPSLATLLAEGGATAEALAHRLGWQRLTVVGPLAEGVGALRPLDHPFAPLFVIKPGSYAWPPAVWESLRSG